MVDIPVVVILSGSGVGRSWPTYVVPWVSLGRVVSLSLVWLSMVGLRMTLSTLCARVVSLAVLLEIFDTLAPNIMVMGFIVVLL